MVAMAWANAALYGFQLYVNGYWSREIGPMSRRHETLITPAPYAFSIWGLIYSLLAIGVIVDCACPSLSIYGSSARPTFLRLMFSVSCVMNMAWVALFSNEYINSSTGVLLVLWLSLFVLYVYIIINRRKNGFSYPRFLCSELPITVYFAWTCAATLIAICVSCQEFKGGYLLLTSYVVFVSILTVASITVIVYESEFAFGLVAVWALIAIAVKDLEFEPPVEQISLSVRACAIQNAAIIAAFILIAIAYRFLVRHNMQQPVKRAIPFLNESNHVDYGTASFCRAHSFVPRIMGERKVNQQRTLNDATRSRLPWMNAGLFVLQLVLTWVGFALGGTDVQEQNDTLITPAGWAFSIWNLIYLSTMIMLVTDIFYPALSLFHYAAKPDLLRVLFAASCMLNGGWCVIFNAGFVHLGTIDITLLWLVLLAIYLFASFEHRVRPFVWREYICSELCFRLYFAWISAATIINWTITFQHLHDGFLSLEVYLAMLGALVVLAITGVVVGGDPVIGVVATWALVALVTKDSTKFSGNDLANFVKIQTVAAFSVGVVLSMLLVSAVQRILTRHSSGQSVYTKLTGLAANTPGYGTTTL